MSRQTDEIFHVSPTDDKHAHDLDNGGLCPCLPRIRERGCLVIHNSYDGREVGEVCRGALDSLAAALAAHDHSWTEEEKDAFDHAILVLGMHWPEKAEETHD